MFWAVKLAETDDPEKYGHSGYGEGVDVRSQFSWSNGSLFKNVVIFGVDNSSSAHVDNEKDILVLGDGPTKGLDDTTITAEANYSINFTMPYNGRNKFLICQCSKNISIESNRFRNETISIMFRKYFKTFCNQ